MRLLFLFLILSVLSGCSSGRASAAGNTDAGSAPELQNMPRAKRMAVREMHQESALFIAADMAQATQKLSVESQPALGGAAAPASPEAGGQKRMVSYNGGIALKATQPAAVQDTAAAWVGAAGGFVESRNGNYAVLRVPVEQFRNFFEKIQTLGVTQNKWMRADDITESFQDNALRIRIAETTLLRLQELLAASTNDDEKIQLLREIQRVSDELESRRNQQSILARQAAYSRLELEVQPFTFESASMDQGVRAFSWFQDLNPRRSEETRLGKKACLNTPDAMVALDLKKAWAASSSDGVEIWAFQRKNNPRGETAFWTQALQTSLAASFARADTFSVGAFSVLRLESYGPDTYVWWIAVQADGRKLYIAETFFPDPSAETRHGNAVRNSLAGGIQ